MPSSIQTNWGYSVASLPTLISVADLQTLCPTLSATTGQLEAVLQKVSAAVRDWCGWHVAPSLECTYTGTGEGRLLMLPAMGVTGVSSLKVGSEAVTAYEWTAAGMVRLTEGAFPESWRSVECVYTAGFMADAVAQVVAQIALNALVAAPGVREEHAGQVGITYNATGSGISGGVSILGRDRELLAPYKLARAW